ncbi:hypothetical protein [Streptomyces sp. TLI_146]|uniref:hypothetical protein n=1 Tax=Streptomyces sp. TLI_146 TaxID=1938858 RepID=UPI000C709FFD|nr:hypothetical protein [Streptomyces sp. TLI_146]PKV82730.1 hypothetical protein BX283_0177 [Streptomyces sp. TLI_146]
MRDFTLDESARTKDDGRLDQLLAAAHTEFVDAIEAAQKPDSVRRVREALVCMMESGDETTEERQVPMLSTVPEPDALVGPALAGALKALAELKRLLKETEQSIEVTPRLRKWARRGVRRTENLVDMLLLRRAVRQEADAFFTKMKAGLLILRARSTRANDERHARKLTAQLSVARAAVAYLFDDSDNLEEARTRL